MKNFIKLFINAVVVISLLAGCKPLAETPPPRNFSTSDLLINPSLLTKNWIITFGPKTVIKPDAMGLHNTLGGSEIDLHTIDSSINHMVVEFPNARDAAKSYNDHDYTRNTRGINPVSWEPLLGFKYTSPRADLFRVVCANYEKLLKLGEQCVIEAQYEEFLSILIYNTTNSNHAIEELETSAKAVDSQMNNFLGK